MLTYKVGLVDFVSELSYAIESTYYTVNLKFQETSLRHLGFAKGTSNGISVESFGGMFKRG